MLQKRTAIACCLTPVHPSKDYTHSRAGFSALGISKRGVAEKTSKSLSWGEMDLACSLPPSGWETPGFKLDEV